MSRRVLSPVAVTLLAVFAAALPPSCGSSKKKSPAPAGGQPSTPPATQSSPWTGANADPCLNSAINSATITATSMSASSLPSTGNNAPGSVFSFPSNTPVSLAIVVTGGTSNITVSATDLYGGTLSPASTATNPSTGAGTQYLYSNGSATRPASFDLEIIARDGQSCEKRQRFTVQTPANSTLNPLNPINPITPGLAQVPFLQTIMGFLGGPGANTMDPSVLSNMLRQIGLPGIANALSGTNGTSKINIPLVMSILGGALQGLQQGTQLQQQPSNPYANPYGQQPLQPYSPQNP